MEEILLIFKFANKTKGIFKRIKQINMKIVDVRCIILFNNASLKNNIKSKYIKTNQVPFDI